jgi:6-pyruvoyltetrahydropterin/6-carboxytetrahydropterin synthase
MPYRICKAFEVESGHMLSKHPGRCRYPHGHSRRIEIIVAADTLDQNDMVCDFKALKLALNDFIDRLDHALAINSKDELAKTLSATEGARVVIFENTDPTTEVLAKSIYDYLEAQIASEDQFTDPDGTHYSLRHDLRVERVRVGETSSSWAEYTH